MILQILIEKYDYKQAKLEEEDPNPSESNSERPFEQLFSPNPLGKSSIASRYLQARSQSTRLYPPEPPRPEAKQPWEGESPQPKLQTQNKAF